jgi:hypothetical protein
MADGAPDREALAKTLWKYGTEDLKLHNGYYLFPYGKDSEADLYPEPDYGADGIIPKRLTKSEIGMYGKEPGANIRDARKYARGYNPQYDDHFVAYHNSQLDKLFEPKREQFLAEFEIWIAAHMDHLAEFLAGETPTGIRDGDARMVTYAIREDWSAPPHHWEWTPEQWLRPDLEEPSAIRQSIVQRLCFIRDRLVYQHRWLSVMCEGLAADPIEVPTANQRPNMRTHIIHHGRQAEQDALNEFAAKLVHPAQRHVAHVRTPESYHRVRLAPPIPSTAPAGQVDWVRRRSQEIYHRPDLCGEPEASAKPELPSYGPESEPRITRRPRAAGNSPNESKENGEER